MPRQLAANSMKVQVVHGVEVSSFGFSLLVGLLPLKSRCFRAVVKT
jgi:hypothetical protein